MLGSDSVFQKIAVGCGEQSVETKDMGCFDVARFCRLLFFFFGCAEQLVGY